MKVSSWDATPYKGDGLYDTCERTCAKLRIYYDEGTSQEITNILGLTPSKQRTKGEIITNSKGGSFQSKRTVWLYSTESECSSLDLRDHLELLLSRLDHRIKDVQKLEGVELGVNCVWWSKGSGGPALASHQMKKLGELGLECSFDVSFFGEDE